MVQVAMLVCAIAAGVFGRSWRQVAVITTVVFVAVVVPQTISVESRPDEAIGAGYWVIQAVSLGLALGATRVLVARRANRTAVVSPASRPAMTSAEENL
jgi:hypothetical protein